MVYTTHAATPIGPVLLSSDGDNLTGLWFEGQKYYGGTILKETEKSDTLPVFVETKNWLDRYFAKKKPSLRELPLLPEGGAFRQAVWRLLCEIPYGQITTYGELARKAAACMNKPRMSAQAVGGAVGHNPISIIIPCHRIVGTNGSLTGYAAGIHKKIKLLELEGVDLRPFYIPSKGTAL